MNYWLLKSEPETFSIQHLMQAPGQTTQWEGVRNYQARNYLKSMQVNDLGFFYHSNCAEPAIVGIVRVTREHYPDMTALDDKSPYFDAKSTLENPRWFVVDVHFEQQFAQPLPLQTLKQNPALAHLPLVRKGNRLSVMPVSAEEWQSILAMCPH